eukprot:scaffold20920_cov67-Phaeocystis_antarctica.AAC.7
MNITRRPPQGLTTPSGSNDPLSGSNDPLRVRTAATVTRGYGFIYLPPLLPFHYPRPQPSASAKAGPG